MWKNWEGEVPTTVSETIAKHEVSEDDYPNINTILTLTIVATLPVTSCSCERSCSTLRRLKTFNRTIMLEERLNGLALLYVHRQVPVDLDVAVDQFANAKPRRMQFNTFMNN